MDAKLFDEPARLSALERYCVLDSQPEPAFERITSLVRSVLDVPIAAVSLVGRDRQWFKSITGFDLTQTPRDVAFCAHTVLSREPMLITDAMQDARFQANPLVTGAPGIRSYAGVPLPSHDGYNLGSLCAIDTRARQFTDPQVEILRNFGSLVVGELELRTIAQCDFVTGVLTRRAFIDGANGAIANFRRHCRSSALVVFDIDRFKAINDTFGHRIGDDVLKTVAARCEATLRPDDMIGRAGGEEFVVCLPQANAQQAMACAERLRLAVERVAVGPIAAGQITASFGVTPLADGDSFDTWFARADAAMYLSKARGRNRCSMAPPGQESRAAA